MNLEARAAILKRELAELKEKEKAEALSLKKSRKWMDSSKSCPDEHARAIAWADEKLELGWFAYGKWYKYNGTFFLQDRDILENVTHWLGTDWMYSDWWPSYGPGVKNYLKYLWNRFTVGAGNIAYDMRPKSWGTKAQLSHKPVFYRDQSGKLTTGFPENIPVPKGYERIVCNTAMEAERYSSLQRSQDQSDHHRQQELRGSFEEAQLSEIRRERNTLIANARNSKNRDFLIAANERFDRKDKPWKFNRESYLHSEAYEDRR